MKIAIEEIHKASLKFLSPLTPEETYSIITTEAVRLVNGKEGSILLTENDELKRVYATSRVLHRIKPRKKGIMYSVYKKGEPVILQTKDIEKIHPAIREAKTKSDIAVPLSYRGKAIGVLTVLSRPGVTFSSKELNTLRYFTPLATLAIKKTQLYNETREALEIRDLFIATAAHELRTPLTALNGYIQLLHKKLSPQQTTESKWVNSLRYESNRLTRLVNELLAVNAIQTGEFQVNTGLYSLVEAVERGISEFKFNYPKHTVAFKENNVKVSNLANIDFDKIVQVIVNLLNNAAKFSPTQKPITVAVSKDKKNWIIKIIDQGIGIKKEEIKMIFESFYKGKGNFRGGMGLGLYLTKTIVEEHGGQMRILSNYGKGTTVEIQLPKEASK
ncbi:MAG: GAF domain-containing sensor histidine kinase [Candidatus Blackburnbacteria bacterium]|nr:GAF domain-containing sensor histidine kinase [Candidatus Blackburnbacteria bacterium]